MKPKGKWSLILSSSLIGEETLPSPTPDEKKKYPRHLSMHHEKELKKKREEKNAEIEEAVVYCHENNCKGYKAIADLNLKLCKDPKTINHHLSREVVPGGDVIPATVLNPGTPTKTSADLPEVISPEGVCKDSAAYWKLKYTQAQEQYSARQQLEFPLEPVDGLLPFKNVKPSETTKKI